ncbi:hypothetical protein C8R43DRAFT_1120043 [Mycena crocata]|nr:hypothetical protein C8R43DRAFT_1120043 [Mycena crocata]
MSAPNQRADHGADVFSANAHHSVLQSSLESQNTLSSPPGSGISAFHSRTHLPTPQSPEFMGNYLNMQPPESPLSYMGYPALGRPSYGLPLQKPMTAMPGRSPQQTMTPESSPYAPRHSPPQYAMNPAAIPHFNPNYATLTPRASSSITLRSTTPPPSVPSPANLSSPFLAGQTPVPSRLSTAPKPTSTPIPVHIDDIFSSNISSSSNPPYLQTAIHPSSTSSVHISTPPTSPSSPSASLPLAAPTPVAGGELERIRQAMMQNQLAQYQEAEARRPDYLKRAKRSSSASETPAPADDDRRPGVGIMDSPQKGRRITLFQETSDESFEESLMAGGYGRYRTADWVRQPQPMATPGPSAPSTAVKPPEQPAQPPRPPTEKELRKRKRLEAFRSNETTNTSDPPTSKVAPVSLEIFGRVLVDTLSEEHTFIPSPMDPSSSKNGTGGKRAMAAANKKAKKKTQEPSAREKRMMLAAALEDPSDKPNWPDTAFPWRLRSEERAEMTREEEQQRMQWIEKFLDRDTDEEDASDEENGRKDGDDEDLLSPTAWSKVYEDGAQRPVPARGGRGKMVPLSADPYAGLRGGRPLGGVKRSRFFPTDPGDARAALLAKKSVRALSYRQQRRQRDQDADSDEEVVCICSNKKDNSEVVQCDHCETWYHLHCIGIRSIADLGREEDPWYCEACFVAERSESSEEGTPEPTFVPTDNEPPRVSRSHDTPLFQPSALQDSPMPWSAPPKTPTRGSGAAREFGSGFSSEASDSRHGPFTPPQPTTPQYPNRRSSVQIFTPGPFDADDVPFDPTSTPSRGIKFFGGFTTPKNTMWPTRTNGLFQTPSKRRDSSSRLFGAPGTLDESASGGGVFSSPFGRMPTYDDSPIRRDTAPAGDGQRARRLLESPIAPSVGGRYLGHAMTTLEDSPVMWSLKGKERAHEGAFFLPPFSGFVDCSS